MAISRRSLAIAGAAMVDAAAAPPRPTKPFFNISRLFMYYSPHFIVVCETGLNKPASKLKQALLVKFSFKPVQ
jgi:hypothetical protein